AIHPHVNDAERRYINGNRPPSSPSATGASQGHHAIPWRRVVRNPNIWLLGVINACTSFYSYMLFLWFPTYLKEGRGLDEISSGRVGSLPYLFGASGVFLGKFADHMKALGFAGRAQWDPAFPLYGAVLFVGGLLWLFVNPLRSVAPTGSPPT